MNGSPQRLTWLGHATAVIELGGRRVVTDPVLRRGMGHVRRVVPVPEAPERLDAILLTHLHHDHLDVPSLRALDPDAVLVVARGAGHLRVIRRLGRPVCELDVGEVLDLDGMRVGAVPAVHDGRRLPHGAPIPALGYVIEGEDRRVYMAGDTEVFDGMRDLGRPDVALLPVAGWGPRTGPGHMDAEEAADAAALVRPAVAIPIHWGTYLRVAMRGDRAAWLQGPADRFAAEVAARQLDVRAVVLRPGGTFDLATVGSTY